MPDQVTIAVDAMGGDSSPSTEVEGAILAAREFGVRVLLCGPEDVLKAELYRARAGSLPIEVVNATEVITMEDSASKALRNKRDARCAWPPARSAMGHAHGMIPGNTGACMAVAKTVMGVVPGVKRPALAQVFPTSPTLGPSSSTSAPMSIRRRRCRARRDGPDLLAHHPRLQQPARRPALDRRGRTQGQRAHEALSSIAA
ncbi:MAG: hypothetical protein R2724_11370 [Bryobacterales bacterium]